MEKKNIAKIVGAVFVGAVALSVYACSPGSEVKRSTVFPSYCHYKHTSNTKNDCYKKD